MATEDNRSSGQFTLKEVFLITNKLYHNRIEFKNRDVVKRITIKEIKQINIDHPSRINNFYRIVSKSFPQYYPYFTQTDRRGRPRRFQRTTAHYYDCVLEMNQLSLNNKIWKARIGSGKRWDSHPPQGKIKSLYRETRLRFREKANRRGRNSEERRTLYRDLVARHRRAAPYLDVGDYNSQEKGLNGDWIFRCDFAYYFHGHRFGRNYYGNVPARETNPASIPFLPKHLINIIEILMQQGIIKDD